MCDGHQPGFCPGALRTPRIWGASYPARESYTPTQGHPALSATTTSGEKTTHWSAWIAPDGFTEPAWTWRIRNQHLVQMAMALRVHTKNTPNCYAHSYLYRDQEQRCPFLQLNIDGWKGKSKILNKLLDDTKPLVVILQETRSSPLQKHQIVPVTRHSIASERSTEKPPHDRTPKEGSPSWSAKGPRSKRN